MYYDGLYLTAQQKERIVIKFEQFVKSNFEERYFTKDLYKHLSLHFGFIAHYNQVGFYSCRFADPEGRLVTFRNIIEASSWCFNDENTSKCCDINTAIKNVCLKYYESITESSGSELLVNLKHQRAALDSKIRSLEG